MVAAVGGACPAGEADVALPTPALDVPLEQPEPVPFDGQAVDAAWVARLQGAMLWAAYQGADSLQKVVPPGTACAILHALEAVVKHEKTLIEVRASSRSTCRAALTTTTLEAGKPWCDLNKTRFSKPGPLVLS